MKDKFFGDLSFDWKSTPVQEAQPLTVDMLIAARDAMDRNAMVRNV